MAKGKQRYIRDTFWSDAYVEKLTPDEKLIFLYLLTNTLCNVAGIYEVRTKRIGFDTGYDIEVVETILNRFKKDGKLFRIDDYIIITNFVKNQSTNPSILQGVERIIQELPENIQQAVADWVDDGLLYLTLPNLTKPNPTKRKKVEKKDSEATSQKKEFKLLVDSTLNTMKPLNDVAYVNWFGNKTQRKAVETLLKSFDHDNIKKKIAYIKRNEMETEPYAFPSVTTPLQLLQKLPNIKRWQEQQK